MPTALPDDPTHTDLVNACLLELSARGVLAWSNRTGAHQIEDRFIRFGLKGSSDILAVVPPIGRLLAVECKTGKGRQRKEQRAFQRAVNRAGGLYVVARSVDDLPVSHLPRRIAA